ncbi:MAG TPA: transglutaminase family protein [Caldimonas sp.]|nr:transglutaminase family protein [Caldimonas sp.]HEX2542470.1 transglutaminase family protein [Caldimonas sp.]
MVRLELELALAYEIHDRGGADFVFNIHAAHTPQQTVRDERLAFSQQVTPEIWTDPATTTRLMRLHAGPGPLHVTYSATVDVVHHVADPETLAEVPVQRLPLDVVPYVYPSRYCQADRLLKLAFDEFGHLWQGYSRVLAIQHWVQKRVTFASNTTNSSTSAVDTLIERVGVCRDFTHLMIALCRALSIPARIATGTDYGASPGLGPPDFHAYVEVYLDHRWYLFDASGTGIPMGFMRFGTGRDAADVAFATIFGGVHAMAPRIDVRAVQGEGLETPQHRREALSTASGSPPPAAADAPPADAPRGHVTQQLPD